ncbi:MAG: GDSL-type esterase/lipase family protein [Candidatus Brocadiia bacterium]
MRHVAAALAAFVAAWAWGAPAPQRGTMQATHVEKGPPMAGTLDSPLWKRCPPLPLGQCTSERPGALETTARVLFGPTHLYVAFACAEPDTDGLHQEVSRRDGQVWQDDCVELFVTGDPRQGYFHFCINPRGTLMDARKQEAAPGDVAWDSSAVVKTAVREGKAWTATLAVPLAELGAFVGEDQTWVMNLNRTRPAHGGIPAAEWSWAIMGSNDYHQVRDYGRVTGVNVPARPDGVTRRDEPPPPPPTYERGREAGGVTVYRQRDAWTIRDEGEGTNAALDLLIRNSTGLKVAFLARGTGGVQTAQFNLYDGRAGDNTTSDAYRSVDPHWRPILYRCDRFVYNEGMNRRVARSTSYRNIRFHGNRTGGKGVLELRRFVIYRGEDRRPPAAPTGLAAEVDDGGVALSWREAEDNVGVAQYVVSRNTGEGWQKIAQTCLPSARDIPLANTTCRYRVLAVDFQDNLGPWSDGLAVAVGDVAYETTRQLSPPERDVAQAAPRVRAIHAAGRGKVVRGRVLCFGDSITGATNYRRYVEAALGRYAVEARGYPAMKTSFGRKKIDEDLAAVNPEFCLIMYGTNNSKAPKAIPPAMDDLVAIAASCERHGTVPIIATIPPRGFKDPQSQPEARFNEALVKTCREHRIPIAHVFQAFLHHEKTGDRRDLLAGDGVHYIAGGWRVTAQAWKAAMDQVLFVLLDRPE